MWVDQCGLTGKGRTISCAAVVGLIITFSVCADFSRAAPPAIASVVTHDSNLRFDSLPDPGHDALFAESQTLQTVKTTANDEPSPSEFSRHTLEPMGVPSKPIFIPSAFTQIAAMIGTIGGWQVVRRMKVGSKRA